MAAGLCIIKAWTGWLDQLPVCLHCCPRASWDKSHHISHVLLCDCQQGRLLSFPTHFTQGSSATAALAQWAALVCWCCGDEQPLEVKVAAAKVLVSCADGVLTNPQLPLGASCCSTATVEAAVNRRATELHAAVFVLLRSLQHSVTVEESVHAAAGRRPRRPSCSR